MSNQKRQPAGQPIGGQFAATARAESNVSLTARSPWEPPDPSPLAAQVLHEGVVKTWAQVIEETKPVGVTQLLIDGDRKKVWALTDGEDTDGQTIVPAKVAKASGLPDLTSPTDRLRDDLTLARVEYIRHHHAGGHDSRRSEKAAAAAAHVRELEEQYNNALKDRDRESIHGEPAMDVIRRMDADQPSDQTRHIAELFASHWHPYVVRAAAANPAVRARLGEAAHQALLGHADETVRANAINGNHRVDDREVFRFLEQDQSKAVRDSARAELAARQINARRVSDTYVRFNAPGRPDSMLYVPAAG